MFEIKVRVGLTPKLFRSLSTKEIRDVFRGSERLFKKLADTDLSFSIQDIEEWDPEAELEGKFLKSFEKIYRKIFLCYVPEKSERDKISPAGSELLRMSCNLYHWLNHPTADVLVGFSDKLPIGDGIAIKELRTSLCLWKDRNNPSSATLIHEILHLCGLKHSLNPFSIMFPMEFELIDTGNSASGNFSWPYRKLEPEELKKMGRGLRKLKPRWYQKGYRWLRSFVDNLKVHLE